jgi:hypothetical protein
MEIGYHSSLVIIFQSTQVFKNLLYRVIRGVVVTCVKWTVYVVDKRNVISLVTFVNYVNCRLHTCVDSTHVCSSRYLRLCTIELYVNQNDVHLLMYVNYYILQSTSAL